MFEICTAICKAMLVGIGEQDTNYKPAVALNWKKKMHIEHGKTSRRVFKCHLVARISSLMENTLFYKNVKKS